MAWIRKFSGKLLLPFSVLPMKSSFLTSLHCVLSEKPFFPWNFFGVPWKVLSEDKLKKTSTPCVFFSKLSAAVFCFSWASTQELLNRLEEEFFHPSKGKQKKQFSVLSSSEKKTFDCSNAYRDSRETLQGDYWKHFFLLRLPTEWGHETKKLFRFWRVKLRARAEHTFRR